MAFAHGGSGRARLTAYRSPLAPAPKTSPDPAARPSSRDRGYDWRWDKASRLFLRRNPLCRACAVIGVTEPATLTDHVLPHRGDMVRFWNSAWWQPACAWHHNQVKQVLERMFDAGEIGAADLWLDSPVAIATAARLRAAPGEGGSKV